MRRRFLLSRLSN